MSMARSLKSQTSKTITSTTPGSTTGGNATGYEPACPVPPGRIIAREIDERGWTPEDLAAVMHMPALRVREIIQGKVEITSETAHQLGTAFGTGPEIWMNLETRYRLAVPRRETAGDTPTSTTSASSQQ